MLRAMRRGTVATLARSMPVRGRHLVCVWLILALAALTVEIGHHSVHHADDQETATCVFACVAGHVSVVSAPPIVAEPIADPIAIVATAAASVDRPARPLGAVQERAPPPFLSA
ncbi:MAG: hypothetical protein C5B48_06485 [Candidatus Rokuibacteriota bacterium]|nr:MAG: hypothetical protein C5B48_06485 [Candidatus Rokubacteria bacterium]